MKISTVAYAGMLLISCLVFFWVALRMKKTRDLDFYLKKAKSDESVPEDNFLESYYQDAFEIYDPLRDTDEHPAFQESQVVSNLSSFREKFPVRVEKKPIQEMPDKVVGDVSSYMKKIKVDSLREVPEISPLKGSPVSFEGSAITRKKTENPSVFEEPQDLSFFEAQKNMEPVDDEMILIQKSAYDHVLLGLHHGLTSLGGSPPSLSGVSDLEALYEGFEEALWEERKNAQIEKGNLEVEVMNLQSKLGRKENLLQTYDSKFERLFEKLEEAQIHEEAFKEEITKLKEKIKKDEEFLEFSKEEQSRIRDGLLQELDNLETANRFYQETFKILLGQLDRDFEIFQKLMEELCESGEIFKFQSYYLYNKTGIVRKSLNAWKNFSDEVGFCVKNPKFSQPSIAKISTKG